MRTKNAIIGLIAVISVLSSIVMVHAGVLALTPLGPENSPLIRYKLSATDPYDIATLDHMYFSYVDPALGTVTGEVLIQNWNARSDGVYIALNVPSIPIVPDDAQGSAVTLEGTYSDGAPFSIGGVGFMWARTVGGGSMRGGR
jgi:hypothetical protein